MTDLYNYIDNGRKAALISDDVYKVILENKETFDKEIDYNRDYNFDFFGFKTLEKSYLLKINRLIVERP